MHEDTGSVHLLSISIVAYRTILRNSSPRECDCNSWFLATLKARAALKTAIGWAAFLQQRAQRRRCTSALYRLARNAHHAAPPWLVLYRLNMLRGDATSRLFYGALVPLPMRMIGDHGPEWDGSAFAAYV